MEEQWRVYQTNPKFEVSNMGNVRWIGGKEPVEVVPKRIGRYYRVQQGGLFINLHMLVAEVWLDKPKTRNKLTVKHIDEDTHNCKASNLEWYRVENKGGRKKHNAEGITVTASSDSSWEDRLSQISFSTPPKIIQRDSETGEWVVYKRAATFTSEEDAIAFANQQ